MIIIFKALGICPLVHNNDANEPVNNRMNRKHCGQKINVLNVNVRVAENAIERENKTQTTTTKQCLPEFEFIHTQKGVY